MGIDPSYAVDTPVAYALFAIATGLVGYATGGGTLPPSFTKWWGYESLQK